LCKKKRSVILSGKIFGKHNSAKGMVWVNLKSKVYHVEGDRYYGKTKSGEWLTEDEAIKKGYRKSKQETKTKK